MKKEEKKPWEGHFCWECAHCTPVKRFNTLSVKGEPTLGECPKWTESKSVLLSAMACKQFKKRI